MNFSPSIYVARTTPVHACDARVKIVLLFAYTLCIFWVTTAAGMLVFAFIPCVLCAVARLPIRRIGPPLVPVAVLAAFSLLFNMANLSVGAFVAVRMLALALVSFVVCFTTTSTELLNGFSRLIAPLRALHVPVDDVAFVLGLAVRFIPVIVVEFARIRMAQAARGAGLAHSFSHTMKTQGAAFASLFVGLFRHADMLADAMDARCYGAAKRRTSLVKRPFTLANACALIAGLALVVCIGVTL